MKIVHAHATIEDSTPEALRHIERAGRTCYKSEDRIDQDSADKFARMIRDKGHLAMFDHVSASVRFVVDRGTSHELVRHRIGVGYAQESTRFCNYSKGKFGSECTFIKPCFWQQDHPMFAKWLKAMETAEAVYLDMLGHGAKPQEARSVLPNSLKTEIVVTGTFTFWRHFFKLRTTSAAHPQMLEVTLPLLFQFIELWAPVFDDIIVPEDPKYREERKDGP
jgi:thymidylate synthase (FAD)